jgi:hypothetical protein
MDSGKLKTLILLTFHINYYPIHEYMFLFPCEEYLTKGLALGVQNVSKIFTSVNETDMVYGIFI